MTRFLCYRSKKKIPKISGKGDILKRTLTNPFEVADAQGKLELT